MIMSTVYLYGTLMLHTAIYKAGTTKRAVSLPIPPGDEFYTAEGLLRNVPRFYEKTASVLSQEGEITVGNKEMIS